MTTLPLTKVRDELTEVVNSVAYRGERVLVKSHGRPKVVIISLDDAALLESIEDKIDIAAAKKALKEGKFHSWDDVKDEIGV